MAIMHYCIQCKDIRSGKIGCFAYDEYKTPSGNIGFYAISGVFSDLTEFYYWAHKNGWNAAPGVLEPIMFPNRESVAGLVDDLKEAAI